MRLSEIENTLRDEHDMTCVHITNEQHSNQRAIACKKEGERGRFKIAELPSAKYSSETRELEEFLEGQ